MYKNYTYQFKKISNYHISYNMLNANRKYFTSSLCWSESWFSGTNWSSVCWQVSEAWRWEKVPLLTSSPQNLTPLPDNKMLPMATASAVDQSQGLLFWILSNRCLACILNNVSCICWNLLNYLTKNTKKNKINWKIKNFVLWSVINVNYSNIFFNYGYFK